MPQRIGLPDGSVGEFPDEMSQENIEAVLRKQYGTPSRAMDNVPGAVPGMAPPSANIPHPELKTQTGLLENTGPIGALNFAKGSIAPYIRTASKAIHQPKQFLNDIVEAQQPQNVLSYFDRQAKQPMFAGFSEHPAETMGETIGAPALLGVAAKSLSEVPAAAGRIRSNLYPQSVNVTPVETGARSLASALNVPEKLVPDFIESAEPEAINVVDYAKRTGTPIKGTADFIKAARNTAGEPQSLFEEKILKPSGNVRVSVRGTGSDIGTGEAQEATLNQINERVSKLNKLLKQAYRQRAAGNPSPLAAKEEMGYQSERDSLAKILADELGKRSGMTPEQITALRQRYGRLHNIADTAEMSLAGDVSAKGKGIRNIDMPGSKHGLLSKALTSAMGGREVIGNRALLKALPKIAGEPTPLPTINPPHEITTGRIPLTQSAGIKVERPEIEIPRPIYGASNELINRQQMRGREVLRNREAEEARRSENRSKHGNRGK